MSARAILLLMLIFMILGSFAFFNPFREKKEEQAERDARVLWLKNKKLEQISLPGQKITLQCVLPAGCPFDGTGEWRLLSPVQDEGDASTIGSFASTLFQLKVEEKIDFENPPDTQEFGLGLGKTVELKVQGENTPYILEVGKNTPVGPNVYLRNKAEPLRLYVVPSYFSEMLTKDLFHWRNKRLFPKAVVEKVTALEWQGKTSVTAKKAEGKWLLERPVKAPANFIMLEGIASTLVYASAKAVAEKAPLGKPLWQAGFSEGEKQHHLELFPGAKKGEYLAQVAKQTYVVDAVPFERLNKPLLEYRERKLFPLQDKTAVKEMIFHFPREKKSLHLKKDGKQWIADETKEPLAQERIDTLLGRLLSSEAHAFFPSTSQAALVFSKNPKDVEVKLLGPQEYSARFLVLERKSLLTESPVPGELSAYGADLLQVMPIRPQDLYQANNTVVVSEPTKEPDGHDHSHSH